MAEQRITVVGNDYETLSEIEGIPLGAHVRITERRAARLEAIGISAADIDGFRRSGRVVECRRSLHHGWANLDIELDAPVVHADGTRTTMMTEAPGDLEVLHG